MKNRNKINYNNNHKTEFKDIIQCQSQTWRAKAHYQM